MHLSSWLQAATVPDRWNVAGVSCPALSVWHHFALEEMRNPIAWDLSEPDMNAVSELLIVCSRDYAGGRRLFTDDPYRKAVQKKMYQAIRYQNHDVVRACAVDYFRSCTRVPGHKSPPVKLVQGMRIATDKDAKFIVAPQEWVLVDFLGRGDPARISDAWNMPFSIARCLYDAHRNAAGEDTLLESRTEEARNDEWLERQAKEKAAAS